MKLRPVFLALLFLCFLATGCVDVDIRTEVHADGSGIQDWRFTTTALLAEKLKEEAAPLVIAGVDYEIALFRSHLHPKLGVAPEILLPLRRHCQPAVPYTLARRLAMRLT